MGANSLDILNNLDSSYGVVGRKALNSLFFLLFSSQSLFKFAQHPNVFINFHWIAFIGVVFLSSGGELLILSISTSWAILSTFEERISNLSNFSSTLLLKDFWVVIKPLSKVSSSEVEFLVLG